ncbi:hypothetical protein FRC01_003941 [Tulasnella sp. 417]|nr:hypothetical protein FRC01_003941 [Tulasnella sp. 417]
MKQFKDLMKNFGIKAKQTVVSPEAMATIAVVCKVVGTISVPGVQTVCTGITEFINVMETAHANDQEWTALLDVMQRYAKRIEGFADSVSHNQPPKYLEESTDKVAIEAREAILEFKREITSSKDKIEARRKGGKIQKRLGATAIQAEIKECRQALADALTDFNGRVDNILVRNTVKSVEITVKPDPYDIPGAKAIQNGDFEIGDDIDFVPPITIEAETNFWDGLVHMDLGDNKLRVAKIYSSKTNSIERFKRDMQFFADNMYLTKENPLKKAGDYLCKQYKNAKSNWRAIAGSMENAAVGSNGQLVIAPSCKIDYLAFPADSDDASKSAIMLTWSQLLVQVVYEQYYRAFRPFALALRKSAREFLEYDTHKLTTPSQVASAIRTLWPAVEDRPYWPKERYFDPGVIAGDVGVFEVNNIYEIRFRRLTNIADAFGGIHLRVHAGSISTPHVYRDTVYSKIDDPNRWKLTPNIGWVNYISRAEVTAAKLAREFTILGERYDVRPSSLAMVMRTKYSMYSESDTKMINTLQTGRPVHCYSTFGPDNRFQSARWSFHDHLPTEEEAAAEASEIEAHHCPKIWPGILGRINYRQFEDEDLEFHLKDPGKEEDPARIELVEESSGSISADTVEPKE